MLAATLLRIRRLFDRLDISFLLFAIVNSPRSSDDSREFGVTFRRNERNVNALLRERVLLGRFSGGRALMSGCSPDGPAMRVLDDPPVVAPPS